VFFLLCVVCLYFFCHCLYWILVHLIAVCNFWIHIWLIAFLAFNSIYRLVFLYFMFRYSAVLIICDFVLLQFVRSLVLLYFFFTCSLSVSAFVSVSIFLVCVIFSDPQLIVPKLYLNTGTVNAPVAVILFLVVNLDFCIILKLLVYSFYFSHIMLQYLCSFVHFLLFEGGVHMLFSPVVLANITLVFSVWMNLGFIYGSYIDQ